MDNKVWGSDLPFEFDRSNGQSCNIRDDFESDHFYWIWLFVNMARAMMVEWIYYRRGKKLT